MATRKHCGNCRHYKGSFGVCPEGYVFISENPDSCLGAYYGICKNGNNETMKQWWDNNSHLPSSEGEELPCYESTDMNACLDDLLELCDKLTSKK